ncbi:MAG: 5-(carboxyamino)imidazole ribonucleotide mutase [Firmicutes bacterium]|nr:5-(carboxyamino)imidazole ribonucleotide mutase [Bacillota bacterium]
MTERGASRVVAIVMGSQSDWETLEHTAKKLKEFEVPYDVHVLSAHRTPQRMLAFAQEAAARGYQVIVAGAGGAAHLPGMIASATLLPVVGVPIMTASLHGLDSLLSIVQMPGGVPVGTMAIGKAGAENAALYAVRILAITNDALRTRLAEYRHHLESMVAEQDRTVKAWTAS